jgi:hypothetical protein
MKKVSFVDSCPVYCSLNLRMKSRELGGLAKNIDLRVPTENENIVWLGSCSRMQISLYLYLYVAYPQRTASTLHSSRTDSMTYEPGLNEENCKFTPNRYI